MNADALYTPGNPSQFTPKIVFIMPECLALALMQMMMVLALRRTFPPSPLTR